MDQMKDSINILAIGDIVGRPGRDLVRDRLPEIVDHYRIDVVIANGENAAGGMSITPETAQEILSWGADVITTGNHVWNSKEISLFIGQEPRLLRPANYPEGVPGKGYFILTAAGFRVCVINLMGRLLMNPIDCPFRKFDALHGALKGEADVFVVDFHAEATSEKQAFGWYADGRATAVYGTHTHVQTADERILPGGTGYISDIGMTGSFNSVIGMDKKKSIERFLTFTKLKYDVASGSNKLNGVVITAGKGGKTRSMTRIVVEN
jgi:metallophosphoesterase (TIGR00282 family)